MTTQSKNSFPFDRIAVRCSSCKSVDRSRPALLEGCGGVGNVLRVAASWIIDDLELPPLDGARRLLQSQRDEDGGSNSQDAASKGCCDDKGGVAVADVVGRPVVLWQGRALTPTWRVRRRRE